LNESNVNKNKEFKLNLNEISLNTTNNKNNNLNNNVNKMNMNLNLFKLDNNNYANNNIDKTERSDKSTPTSQRVPHLRNIQNLNSDEYYEKLLKNYDPEKDNHFVEDFNIKDTLRKEAKLKYFDEKISPMYEDKLYVGG